MFFLCTNAHILAEIKKQCKWILVSCSSPFTPVLLLLFISVLLPSEPLRSLSCSAPFYLLCFFLISPASSIASSLILSPPHILHLFHLALSAPAVSYSDSDITTLVATGFICTLWTHTSAWLIVGGPPRPARDRVTDRMVLKTILARVPLDIFPLLDLICRTQRCCRMTTKLRLTWNKNRWQLKINIRCGRMQKWRENTEEEKLKEHSHYLTDGSYLKSDLQTFLPRRMKTEHKLNKLFLWKITCNELYTIRKRAHILILILISEMFICIFWFNTWGIFLLK